MGKTHYENERLLIQWLRGRGVIASSGYQIYVARGCSSLKGMWFLYLAGAILDWQWWRCVKWLLLEMPSRTCNITISPICGLLLI